MTQTRPVIADRAGAAGEPVGGFPYRRFGARRAAALIRLLHGTGPTARLRGFLDIVRNR